MTDKYDENVQEFADVVAQMVKDDEARDNLYAKIDRAVECKFSPSEEVTKLPWVKERHYGLTQVADARNTGTRTFSTLLPKIEISPNDESDAEYNRVEMAEQLWDWEFERMNRVQSKKGFHDRIVESAVTYHSVAFQTQYLPFKYKDTEKTQRIKSLLAKKNFSWTIHHPGTVHSQTSDEDQLLRVAKVVHMTAQELMDNFEHGDEDAQKGAAKLRERVTGKTKADLMKLKYTLVDAMDWDRRVKWAYESTGDVVASDIVFMNAKHKLPFIPWVVIDYGDPLWKSIIQSGLWENVQYANLIMFAKAIEQSTRSTIVIKTPDGELHNVWIDFTNPSNPIVAPAGTEITNLAPAPIDPQLSSQFQEMLNAVASSTVSQVLTNIGQYESAPFSTVERIVQLALGQLSPAKKTAEAAEAEGIYQGFQWIEHSTIPMIGYRSETSDIQGRGGEIGIYPGAAKGEYTPNKVYFDLSYLYVNVKLQADNVADEQSRMNNLVVAVDRLGLSEKNAWEKLGWKNYGLNKRQKEQETIDKANQQAVAQKILGLAEVQVQRESARVQQEQQTNVQNMQNQLNAGTQFETLQGRDMRAGGNPAAQVAPLETREQVTGQTVAGQQMV